MDQPVVDHVNHETMMSEEICPNQRTGDLGDYDIPLISAAAELKRHLALTVRRDVGVVCGNEVRGSFLRMQTFCGRGRP